MSIKAYLTASILSFGIWMVAYQAFLASYRVADHAGLIPHLHIAATLASLIG